MKSPVSRGGAGASERCGGNGGGWAKWVYGWVRGCAGMLGGWWRLGMVGRLRKRGGGEERERLCDDDGFISRTRRGVKHFGLHGIVGGGAISRHTVDFRSAFESCPCRSKHLPGKRRPAPDARAHTDDLPSPLRFAWTWYARTALPSVACYLPSQQHSCLHMLIFLPYMDQGFGCSPRG